ncbi:hypothetical protein GPJ56_008164 [Histomonas meleagridis]|uniref:uncharacterized protein n=1 Tax=Histomonas meleagridis TaxID=135588 RepID=UPI003559CE38|nr:hypothetical protein GPJ56_008164 [Histomonas meleagridis]KAH0803096.1 hypothetical protein GO595_004189 [Histomonas meleagridis]
MKILSIGFSDNDFDFSNICPESMQSEDDEKPYPIPPPVFTLLAPCLMPDNEGQVKSIYFSNVGLLKGFIKENPQLVENWIIVLPIVSIGAIRYDRRRKDVPSYLIHPQLINLPQH